MTFTTLLIKMKAVASYPGQSISITCGGSIACVLMIILTSIYERTILREGVGWGGGGGGVVRPTRPTPGYGPALCSCSEHATAVTCLKLLLA